jgi:hypothetical protein
MTPDQAARAVLRFDRDLARALQDAERESLRQAEQEAWDSSSGPFKLSTLKKMGHPYATRNPRPPLSAGVINTQSGAFRGNWRPTSSAWSSDELTNRLVNSDPVSEYMSGTSLMISRPIVERVEQRIAADREQRLEDGVRGVEP